MPFSVPLLRLHLLCVLAFLIFYTAKAVLLFAGRHDTLRSLRARTRLADSGLGLAVLASGGALLATYPGAVPAGLWLKAATVPVLLVVAVAALRRQLRPGVAAALLGWLYVYGVADARSLAPRRAAPPVPATAAGQAETTATPEPAPVAPSDTLPATATGLSAAEEATLSAAATAEAAAAVPPPAETTEPPALANGKALFVKHCTVCHGPDGKLGRNGAHNLTRSNLNAAGRVYLVTQGLGKMPAFKGRLTEEQIQQVVAYSLQLSQ